MCPVPIKRLVDCRLHCLDWIRYFTKPLPYHAAKVSVTLVKDIHMKGRVTKDVVELTYINELTVCGLPRMIFTGYPLVVRRNNTILSEPTEE